MRRGYRFVDDLNRVVLVDAAAGRRRVVAQGVRVLAAVRVRAGELDGGRQAADDIDVASAEVRRPW